MLAMTITTRSYVEISIQVGQQKKPLKDTCNATFKKKKKKREINHHPPPPKVVHSFLASPQNHCCCYWHSFPPLSSDCHAYIAAHWNHFLELSCSGAYNFWFLATGRRQSGSNPNHNSHQYSSSLSADSLVMMLHVVHSSEVSVFHLNKHDMRGQRPNCEHSMRKSENDSFRCLILSQR